MLKIATTETDMTYPAACVMGAFVADAASLGLHWLYDVDRIAEVEAGLGGLAFVPLDRRNYDGVAGYYAHGARGDGALTHYGETLRLALQDSVADGFDAARYQAAFAAHFGAGGAYCGYIDRPTRATLANLAAGQDAPSGSDDDQLPALNTLPAVVVAHHRQADLAARVQAAIEVGSVNADATAYGQLFAALLARLMQGQGLAEALTEAASGRPELQAALVRGENDPVAYGETTGRACHLSMAMPLAFHILARAGSYAEAVEANIRAGGDSAGRAIVIGSVLGLVHGIEGKGIALDWILKTRDAPVLWSQSRQIAALGAVPVRTGRNRAPVS